MCVLNQRISDFAGIHFQFAVTDSRFQRFNSFHVDIAAAWLHQLRLRIAQRDARAVSRRGFFQTRFCGAASFVSRGCTVLTGFRADVRSMLIVLSSSRVRGVCA